MPEFMLEHGYIVAMLWIFVPPVLMVMFIEWFPNRPTRQERYLRKRLMYRPSKNRIEN